jgi:hypothetical protein
MSVSPSSVSHSLVQLSLAILFIAHTLRQSVCLSVCAVVVNLPLTLCPSVYQCWSVLPSVFWRC